jgi:hypothetical protein
VRLIGADLKEAAASSGSHRRVAGGEHLRGAEEG